MGALSNVKWNSWWLVSLSCFCPTNLLSSVEPTRLPSQSRQVNFHFFLQTFAVCWTSCNSQQAPGYRWCKFGSVLCLSPTNPLHIWCTTLWDLQKQGTYSLQKHWCRNFPHLGVLLFFTTTPQASSTNWQAQVEYPISCLAWLDLLVGTNIALRATSCDNSANHLRQRFASCNTTTF